MRFYDIQVTNQSNGQLQTRADGTPFHWTSHPNGINAPPDPGALNVEFDLLVFNLTPATESKPDQAQQAGDIGNSWLRIWGVSLADIGQAINLTYSNILISGGMGVGYPLANPAQAGPLVAGMIFPGYGNWMGTDMSIEFRITGGYKINSRQPVNLAFQWKAGTKMADIISQTLVQAYPGISVATDISDNLVRAYTETGYYPTLGDFARWVNDASQDIMGGNYTGVKIVPTQAGFYVYDGTKSKTPKQIEFTDMIGQATWIGPQVIQVSVVMRSDIAVGDSIKLPPGQVALTSGGATGVTDSNNNQLGIGSQTALYKLSSIFQGAFLVHSVRHVGNFRSPDGQSWITTITAAVIPS